MRDRAACGRTCRAEVERLVTRALSRAPRDRQPSMTALKDEVLACLGVVERAATGPDARARRWRARHRWCRHRPRASRAARRRAARSLTAWRVAAFVAAGTSGPSAGRRQTLDRTAAGGDRIARARRPLRAPQPTAAVRPGRRGTAGGDHRGAGHRVDALARAGSAAGREQAPRLAPQHRAARAHVPAPRPSSVQRVNAALGAAIDPRARRAARDGRGARARRAPHVRCAALAAEADPARKASGGAARVRAAPPPAPAAAGGRDPGPRPGRLRSRRLSRGRCAAAARRSPPGARSAATCWWAMPTTDWSASRMRCASTRPRCRWIRATRRSSAAAIWSRRPRRDSRVATAPRRRRRSIMVRTNEAPEPHRPAIARRADRAGGRLRRARPSPATAARAARAGGSW